MILGLGPFLGRPRYDLLDGQTGVVRRELEVAMGDDRIIDALPIAELPLTAQ